MKPEIVISEKSVIVKIKLKKDITPKEAVKLTKEIEKIIWNYQQES